MKEKQIPIRREVTYSSGIDILEAAVNGSDVEQRSIVFLEKIKGYITSVAEFEDKICFGSYTVVPRYKNKYWLHYKAERGFTYNKKTKTVKAWFGKPLRESMLLTREFIDRIVIKQLGFNFLDNPTIKQVPVTLRVLNKVLKGKITNPRDYVHAVFKEIFPKIQVSKEILWRLVSDNRILFDRFQFDLQYVIHTCDNVDRLFNYWIDNEHTTSHHYLDSLKDLAIQAMVLGQTHSYCWSKNKLEEIHNEATRKIAIEKFKKVPFKEYDYEGTLPEHPHLTLLTNNKDIFAEGNVMSHCLYTNFEYFINRKTYFAFSYKSETERGTLGVSVDYHEHTTFNQFYGRKNSPMSVEAHKEVNEYISREDVQEFFKKNKVLFQNYELQDVAVQAIAM